ncbi:MAG: PIG-L family deacetylase [Comamonadaceae bacterium]|nr:MAG: PIG-L family deacetylase [Comamonadaceae bacterium]
MLSVDLGATASRPPRFLFIGAHCDDIEIGCGGTVIELLKRHPHASVHWVVLSSGAQRRPEALRAAQALLRGVRDKVVCIEDFRGSYFPSEMPAIKEYFETLKVSARPDVVFTHCRDDLHQDHRITGELTWNTFRDHLILEYEIPKYDGGLGSPSVFVPVSKAAVQRKVNLLMRTFKTQLQRTWFTPETFEAIMRLRGIECNAPSGYAEAFYSRKLVLSTS